MSDRKDFVAQEGGSVEKPVEVGRVHEIDAIRGLSLCGIVFVNIVGITEMPTRHSPTDASLRFNLYETMLHQRFFPIFSFVFGLSFALFLQAANKRVSHPHIILLARLGYLILFGALHRLLQPDEVLLTYAVVGIVVLLPASFLPRYLVLALGVIAVSAALVVSDGGTLLIPGLFLLGLATAYYEIPRSLKARRKQIFVVFAFSCLSALALNIAQVRLGLFSSSRLSAAAGIATSAVYVSGLLLLWFSPVRKLLCALEPLGRMALTNYIAATLMIIAADHVIHLNQSGTPRYGAVMSLGVIILVVQGIWSRLWLERFRYGPLEWLWRCLTWWHRIPNRVPA